MDITGVILAMSESGMWSEKTMTTYELVLNAESGNITGDGAAAISSAVEAVYGICKENNVAIPFELDAKNRQEAQDIWLQGGYKADLTTGTDTEAAVAVDNPYWMVGEQKIHLFDPAMLYISYAAEPHGQSADGTDIKLFIPASVVKCDDGETVQDKLDSGATEKWTDLGQIFAALEPTGGEDLREYSIRLEVPSGGHDRERIREICFAGSTTDAGGSYYFSLRNHSETGLTAVSASVIFDQNYHFVLEGVDITDWPMITVKARAIALMDEDPNVYDDALCLNVYALMISTGA